MERYIKTFTPKLYMAGSIFHGKGINRKTGKEMSFSIPEKFTVAGVEKLRKNVEITELSSDVLGQPISLTKENKHAHWLIADRVQREFLGQLLEPNPFTFRWFPSNMQKIKKRNVFAGSLEQHKMPEGSLEAELRGLDYHPLERLRIPGGGTGEVNTSLPLPKHPVSLPVDPEMKKFMMKKIVKKKE